MQTVEKIYGQSIDCYAGDTKVGTLVGKDKFGNKFYENLEDELPRMCTTMATYRNISADPGGSTYTMGRLQGEGI